MKKIFTLFIITIMLFTLLGCGFFQPNNATTQTPDESLVWVLIAIENDTGDEIFKNFPNKINLENPEKYFDYIYTLTNNSASYKFTYITDDDLPNFNGFKKGMTEEALISWTTPPQTIKQNEMFSVSLTTSNKSEFHDATGMGINQLLIYAMTQDKNEDKWSDINYFETEDGEMSTHNGTLVVSNKFAAHPDFETGEYDKAGKQKAVLLIISGVSFSDFAVPIRYVYELQKQ